MQLVIGHLYPQLMNLYGDRGNVTVLERRCSWRSIDVVVTAIDPEDRPWLSSFDILFIGGGQDREQRMVADLLTAGAGGELKAAAEDGLVIFAVCGGYQLLGDHYILGNGQKLAGAGVFSAWTDSGDRRMVGDVSAVVGDRRLVGFENHVGRTWLGPEAEPLARVKVGGGNNGQDGTEGAIRGNAVGTYLHGPVLPKNPWLADELISRALARRYGKVDLPELDDTLEQLAGDTAAARAGRRQQPNIN